MRLRNALLDVRNSPRYTAYETRHPRVVRMLDRVAASAMTSVARPISLDGSVESRMRWIDRLRPRWIAIVRPRDEGIPSLFDDAPKLSSRHIEHCRVSADRYAMIAEHLPTGGVVAEVGTYRGEFSAYILETAKPETLHLIDMSFELLQREPLAEAIASGRVVLHEQDSSTALEQLPDASCDWIYIDADHRYAGVKRDVEVAKRKVKPGGALAFNDYIFWSHWDLVPVGVVQAVNELCVDDDWEFVAFALHGQMYCDVLLRRIADRTGEPTSPA
jgi:predicted O-methyltransferase YrrM